MDKINNYCFRNVMSRYIFIHYFHAEELIHYFQILLHAVSSLILPTKDIFVNKLKKFN